MKDSSNIPSPCSQGHLAAINDLQTHQRQAIDDQTREVYGLNNANRTVLVLGLLTLGAGRLRAWLITHSITASAGNTMGEIMGAIQHVCDIEAEISAALRTLSRATA